MIVVVVVFLNFSCSLEPVQFPCSQWAELLPLTTSSDWDHSLENTRTSLTRTNSCLKVTHTAFLPHSYAHFEPQPVAFAIVHSPECVEFPDACVCLSPAFHVTCLPSPSHLLPVVTEPLLFCCCF